MLVSGTGTRTGNLLLVRGIEIRGEVIICVWSVLR